MKRMVAIKMLPAKTLTDAAAVARFQREVEAAAKLEHANIVAAHDADEANGVHFLVMQYVAGSDLSALVKKNGPLAITRAVDYILQAARGLDYAHKHGVIHRDIKPGNLLLDNEGIVKILDMGLARIEGDGNVNAQAELTATGDVMGTVDYMAPEQARSTHSADARADIYSLGCSLFYLLTAKPLYGGDTITNKLIAHQFDPIPSLRDVRADVPEQLEMVLRKMIAKSVDERYQSMSQVIAELEQCQETSREAVEGTATCFMQAPAVTQGRRKGRSQPSKRGAWYRNRVVLVSTGFLGALILAGVIYSVRTKDGTLIVEVDQPDATVQVLDTEGRIEIRQNGTTGKISIGVDPGKHKIKVEKDGFVAFGQDFELESGGNVSIRAKLVPINAQPVAANPSQAIKSWNSPEFQAWTKSVAEMPAEQQIEAVRQKLIELNPGFDGKLRGEGVTTYPRIGRGAVLSLGFDCDVVKDISPVRALTDLEVLICIPSGNLSDLSPLEGMKLRKLSLSYCQILWMRSLG